MFFTYHLLLVYFSSKNSTFCDLKQNYHNRAVSDKLMSLEEGGGVEEDVMEWGYSESIDV